MAYRLPQFPLSCNIWRYSNWAGTIPPVNMPDNAQFVNLIPGRRNFDSVVNLTSYLLLPFGTDIRFSENGIWTGRLPTNPDLVECPAGSGRYYTVWDVETSGGGFANEHIVASITKKSPFGGGGSGPPPPGSITGIGYSLWPDGSPAGSATIHFISTVLVHDLIIVLVAVNPAQLPVVSDSLGNLYTSFNAASTSSADYLVAYWTLSSATGGLTVTITPTASPHLRAGVSVWRGGGPTMHPIVGGTAFGGGVSATVASTGGAGVTLAWGAGCVHSTGVQQFLAASSPFVRGISVDNVIAPPAPCILEVSVLNDPTIRSATLTVQTFEAWCTIAASFLP